MKNTVLTKNEAKVLHYRFCEQKIEGRKRPSEFFTLEEAAQEMGITAPRVRMIERNAIKKILCSSPVMIDGVEKNRILDFKKGWRRVKAEAWIRFDPVLDDDS